MFVALGDWICCELYTCNLIMLWNLVFLDEQQSTEKWPVYVFHVNQCDVDGNKPRSVPALMDLINVADVTCVCSTQCLASVQTYICIQISIDVRLARDTWSLFPLVLVGQTWAEVTRWPGERHMENTKTWREERKEVKSVPGRVAPLTPLHPSTPSPERNRQDRTRKGSN